MISVPNKTLQTVHHLRTAGLEIFHLTTADPLGPAVRHATPSGLTMDAKSLFDSVKKEPATHSVACKRTAVELQVLRHTGTVLQWESSERQ